MLYGKLIKPLLFSLPPEQAHHIVTATLSLLGKVPGGGAVQRTTDANGRADFGVLPVLPSGVVYEITIGAVPEKAQVEVAGAKDGVVMQKNIEHAVGERAAATTIRLDADGKTPLVVTVTAESARPQPAAAGKPKSN